MECLGSAAWSSCAQLQTLNRPTLKELKDRKLIEEKQRSFRESWEVVGKRPTQVSMGEDWEGGGTGVLFFVCFFFCLLLLPLFPSLPPPFIYTSLGVLVVYWNWGTANLGEEGVYLPSINITEE